MVQSRPKKTARVSSPKSRTRPDADRNDRHLFLSTAGILKRGQTITIKPVGLSTLRGCKCLESVSCVIRIPTISAKSLLFARSSTVIPPSVRQASQEAAQTRTNATDDRQLVLEPVQAGSRPMLTRHGFSYEEYCPYIQSEGETTR